MEDEGIFRGVAAVLIICVFGMMTYFRWMAAQSDEKISRKGEGKLIWMRLFALPIFYAVITFIINPRLMQWSVLPLPLWLRWLGVSCAAICVPATYWVLKHLGGNITDTVFIRQNHTLVTTGPYRWVRHPFYSMVLIMFAAWSFITSSYLVMLMIIPFGTYLILRTPIEEAKLMERFGAEYRFYRARTGAIFPRLRRSS